MPTDSAGGWGAWLGLVLVGTGLAGLAGKLPGVEPRPYIIRFTEDWPNPLYRRICYTLAWSEAVTFAVLNIAGLAIAIVTGLLAAAADLRGGLLSNCRHDLVARCAWPAPARQAVDQREGHERRYFYGSVWAVCVAQPVLWVLWKALPETPSTDAFKLAVFVGILAWVGNRARLGLLPRTRPIVPGELAVSD